MKHLVVALYKEDPRWINDVPEDWDVFVYHKGDQLFLPRANVIKLPNHGRECHSYFTHIVNHYDALADITIFCQGKYEDHTPDLDKYLSKNTIHEMAREGDPLSFPDKGYVSLGKYWLHDAKMIHTTRQYTAKLWLYTFGHVAYPRYAKAAWGHQFAATSGLLRKFSKEWYEQIIKDHENPRYKAAPYVMEQYLPELYLDIGVQKSEVITKLFA